MTLVQISDTHITEQGELAYGRFDTARALEHAVSTINAMQPQPDLVLHTGDITSHGTPARYQRFLSIVAALRAPLYLMPGNHDERGALRGALQGCESPAAYLPASGEFLHYAIDGYPLRIICCDTVIADEVPGELCPERLEWLADRLTEAPHKPTIVAMHHPPFYTGMSGSSSKGLLRGGERLCELLRANPQVLRVIAGHVHRPVTASFAGTIGFTAPTTCYPFGLDTGPERILSISHEPPGIAVHLWLGDATPEGTALVSHVLPLGEWPAPLAFLKDGVRVLTT